MDKTNIFDINAAAYHRVRPFYPIALFDDIKKYSCINPNDNILEIGFGTGQATRAFINDDYHVFLMIIFNSFTQLQPFIGLTKD